MKNVCLLLVPVLALLTAGATSAVEPINSKGRSRLAVHGYDVVAYFDGEAQRGSEDFVHSWMDAVWHFATAETRDRFAADPKTYAPQYGGYCAYAVSKGYTADVDPEAWTVHAGKLYLNNSKSVRVRWSKDIPGNIVKADSNWPKLLAE